MLNEYDVAIVFSGDTDLIPAVEMAFRRTTPGSRSLRGPGPSRYGSRPRWPPADGSRGVTSSYSRTSMPYVTRRSTSRSREAGRTGLRRRPDTRLLACFTEGLAQLLGELKVTP